MRRHFIEFWTREDGQDLVEYTLLLAFICFTVIGLAHDFSASVAGIAGESASQLAAANVAVS
jgi:Flp pilus assembly pilin Flp